VKSAVSKRSDVNFDELECAAVTGSVAARPLARPVARPTRRPRLPAADRRSINPFRTLIRHRNFRLFWTGQTLSLIGTWMQQMAQGWLALELSNSPFLVGLVVSIGSMPILLLSLPAGLLADRVPKLRLVTIMQTVMLLEATALWLLSWTHHITIGWLLVLAAVNGIASAFEIPARQAMIVELVGREDLHDAIALNSSGFNLARVIGPAAGAAVIATAGMSWCFALNAASYLAVLAGLALIRMPPELVRPLYRAPSAIAGMLDGLRYMRETREINALMQVVTVFSVFGIPFIVLMPVVARDLLHTGAAGYGVLLACVGVGGLSGALFLAAVGRRLRRGRLLQASCYAYASLLVLFALSRSVLLACILLFGVGFAMIVNGALANGLLQGIVPDSLRGRLMAAYSFVVVGLSQVVGAFLAGSAANTVGVDWTIGGAAVVLLAYTRWAYGKWPELRRLR
jgi:MFS family permease